MCERERVKERVTLSWRANQTHPTFCELWLHIARRQCQLWQWSCCWLCCPAAHWQRRGVTLAVMLLRPHPSTQPPSLSMQVYCGPLTSTSTNCRTFLWCVLDRPLTLLSPAAVCAVQCRYITSGGRGRHCVCRRWCVQAVGSRTALGGRRYLDDACQLEWLQVSGVCVCVCVCHVTYVAVRHGANSMSCRYVVLTVACVVFCVQSWHQVAVRSCFQARCHCIRCTCSV